MPFIKSRLYCIFQPAKYALEPIYNGYIAVDTFFFIAGCLIGLIIFKQMDSLKERFNGKVPIWEWIKFSFMVFVNRYLRLSVVYAFIIGFLATYFKFALGNFERFNWNESEKCQNNWYINLLFANNFWKRDEQCIVPSWYISCEMQMFLLTPFIIYPLWKCKKKGKILTSVAWCLMATLVPMSIIIAKDWPIPRRTNDDVEFDKYFMWMRSAPWTNYGAYVPGIITGYIFHITKNKRIHFKWASCVAIFAVNIPGSSESSILWIIVSSQAINYNKVTASETWITKSHVLTKMTCSSLLQNL